MTAIQHPHPVIDLTRVTVAEVRGAYMRRGMGPAQGRFIQLDRTGCALGALMFDYAAEVLRLDSREDLGASISFLWGVLSSNQDWPGDAVSFIAGFDSGFGAASPNPNRSHQAAFDNGFRIGATLAADPAELKRKIRRLRPQEATQIAKGDDRMTSREKDDDTS